MSKRGGARKGSGPKVKGPYRRRSVCIDDKLYDIVKAYGEGNFSVGIRQLCRLLEMNDCNEDAEVETGNKPEKPIILRAMSSGN
jgi:hypothetical protein